MELKWRLSQARGYLGLGMVEEAGVELDRVPAEAAQQTEVLALRALVLQEQAKWPPLVDVARKLVLRQPAESGWWITWAYATRRSRLVVIPFRRSFTQSNSEFASFVVRAAQHISYSSSVS